jgi:hypothetical protein
MLRLTVAAAVPTAARAASVWTHRTRVEREAAVRFASVAERLARTRAPQIVVDLARNAAHDERRHAALCEGLAIGFEPRIAARDLDRAAAPPHPAPAALPSGLTAREHLLLEVVSMSCVTETLSTALLGEMYERATDHRVREVVHEVLRDEVQHSRLGWAYLASEHARGSVAFLADYLPEVLAGTVTEELFRPIDPDGTSEDANLAGLGALERTRRLSIFAGTMRAVVFPGLARFGVDPAAAEGWLVARVTS